MKTYTVWMVAPVNVRVKATSAEEAKKIALDIINDSERPEEVDGDDNKAVYFDGSAWALDPFCKNGVVFEHEDGDGTDMSDGPVINPSFNGKAQEVSR